MNFRELIEKYKPIIKENLVPIALAFLGLIFFGYGLIVFLNSSKSSNDITFQPSGQENQTSKNIVVDIEGAVIKPGVYRLVLDSRISDALVAASGLSSQADREWVAKNLNLATVLTDGAKIYIPRTGESVTESRGDKGATGATTIENGSSININMAGESELDSLPGVGPVTAQKIILGRPYSSIDDLLNKKIVGQKVFDQIKGRITIW